MRNDQLLRVLQLAERLRSGRHTLASLAGEFDVTTRTIRRDLEALSLAGVAVRKTTDNEADGQASYWWLARPTQTTGVEG